MKTSSKAIDIPSTCYISADDNIQRQNMFADNIWTRLLSRNMGYRTAEKRSTECRGAITMSAGVSTFTACPALLISHIPRNLPSPPKKEKKYPNPTNRQRQAVNYQFSIITAQKKQNLVMRSQGHTTCTYLIHYPICFQISHGLYPYHPHHPRLSHPAFIMKLPTPAAVAVQLHPMTPTSLSLGSFINSWPKILF